MSSFEGFLERCTLADGELHVRLVVGGFDPSPSEPPVLRIAIHQPEAAQSTYDALCRVRDGDCGVYFEALSASHAILQSDHGQEVHLRGAHVKANPEQFEPQDFERLAKSNHEWGSGLSQALQKALVRNNNARGLVEQQAARVEVKLQGHEPGSTARTLYEQHLAFLNRLLQELGV
jgi:hypothetical protein